MREELRCHFSSVVTATLRGTWALLTMLFYFIFNAWDEGKGMLSSYLWMAMAGLLLLILLIFFLNFLRWRRTYIYFDQENLVVDRRLKLSAIKQTLRPATIASINLQQGIFDRIFGTYRLQFDIDSSATADKTDFNLVFAKKTAQEIKEELERRRAALPEGGAIGADAAAAVAAAKPPLEVIRCFSFLQVARHAVLATPLWSIFYTLISVPLVIFFVFNDISLQRSIDLRTLITIALALWPLLVQTVAPFFRYFGFTLARQGSEVLISCGLLTRHHFTLPLEKTNAVIISQPMLARFFGYAYGEIINVGMGDREQGIVPAFSLLITKGELYQLLWQIAPDFVLLDVEEEPSPKQALPVLLFHYGLWGLAGLAAGIFFDFWWAGVLFLALMLTSGWASWRTKALALTHDRLAISSGVFSRQTVVTYYGKLQNLHSSNGPLARRLGLAQGMVTILSSSLRRNNRIGYFPEERFSSISRKMLEQTR